jgi:hypothetical protein
MEDRLLAIITLCSAIAAILAIRSAITSAPVGDQLDRFAAAAIAAYALAEYVGLARFALVAIVAVLLSPDLPILVAFHHLSATQGFDMVSLVAVATLVTAHPTIARQLGKEFSARTLFISVNLLNALDALLTFMVVSGGGGTEANPLVRAIGLPAKVVGGLAATWFIKRRRPRALLVPLAVLPAVIVWHISGTFLNM